MRAFRSEAPAPETQHSAEPAYAEAAA
jgi:hypothetical protein